MRRYGDEITGPDPDLNVIDHNDARSSKDRIRVLGSIVAVVVAYRLSAGGKFDLIEPEGANPELVADAFIERAGGRMRPGTSGDLGRVA